MQLDSLGALGGRTSTFNRLSQQYPQQMREVMDLFRILGISGKEGLSRASIQAMTGFPILKRKAELLKQKKAAWAHGQAAYIANILYPKPVTPAVAKASGTTTDPETPMPIGSTPDVKQNAPTILALVGGSLLFSMMG